MIEATRASYLKNAKAFQKRAPDELFFEEIVEDKSLEVSVGNGAVYEYYYQCPLLAMLPERIYELRDRGSGRANSKSTSQSAALGEKLDPILEILNWGATTTNTSDQAAPADKPKTRDDVAGTNFSRPRTPTTWPGTTNERHHTTAVELATANPNCIHAVQHTTHPSAPLPAFTAAEAALRGRNRPGFVRWC
ncbi:hypothetical protein F4779DRAFT_613731 [Xylariaceae sp. FL0662B]|nr:hypothetical protein F4779DRAFT_613731 [Xylariaceae sp. FL0662B]